MSCRLVVASAAVTVLTRRPLRGALGGGRGGPHGACAPSPRVRSAVCDSGVQRGPARAPRSQPGDKTSRKRSKHGYEGGSVPAIKRPFFPELPSRARVLSITGRRGGSRGRVCHVDGCITWMTRHVDDAARGRVGAPQRGASPEGAELLRGLVRDPGRRP